VLRTLLTRRWVVTTLVLAALIPTFYRLGLWQYHRYQQTNRNNQLINANLHAVPEPMTSVSKPGGSVPFSEMYRTVTATGHYDTAHEFVVRQRTDASGDNLGYYVVTPLLTASGEEVLVNRGWVQPNAQDGNAYPAVPPAPTGTVTVTGRLRPDETTASTGIRQRFGLPPHQYMMINSTEQAKNLAEPVVAGYLELTGTTPAPPAADLAQPVPSPNNTDSNSMAVVGKGVHLPYAIQWWIFAAAVPVAWWVLLRRDVKEQRSAVEPKATPTGDPKTPAPSPSGAAEG
jgi:cytochrome oxidase assembly protein ShyY1